MHHLPNTLLSTCIIEVTKQFLWKIKWSNCIESDNQEWIWSPVHLDLWSGKNIKLRFECSWGDNYQRFRERTEGRKSPKASRNDPGLTKTQQRVCLKHNESENSRGHVSSSRYYRSWLVWVLSNHTKKT